MNKMRIGNYLENGIENGTINADQICVYIDKNNNIKWIGKAEYAPIYLDWATLDHAETVGNELRLYEERTSTEEPEPQAQQQEAETMTEPKPTRGTIASTGERCEMRANGYWTNNGKHITSYERIDKPIEYNKRGAPVIRQYSMDRHHKFYVETEDEAPTAATAAESEEVMKANSPREAWTIAREIFPTELQKDDESSSRAGYPIYRSTTRHYCYICELGDRLEINLDDGRTINIWISPEEDEATETARYIEAIHAAREHGAQIRPHHTENRIKLQFAIDGDEWNSEREKAVYKALKDTKRRAEIISELITSYCEANAIPWATLDTTHAQHFHHGKRDTGHFIISAYITTRDEISREE